MKYRTKPQTALIEAVKFDDTPESIEAISELVGRDIHIEHLRKPPTLRFKPDDGNDDYIELPVDTWVCRNPRGSVFWCADNFFQQHYDPA